MSTWFALLVGGAALAQSAPQQPAPTSGMSAAPQMRSIGRATTGAQGFPALTLFGAPIVDKPFALQIENARPSTTGFLLIGREVTPHLLPMFGVVLQPSSPLERQVFDVDVDGASRPLRVLDAVPLALVGHSFVAQAALLDEAAMGGVAFTKAILGRFGVGGSSDLFDHRILRGSEVDLVTEDFDQNGTMDLLSLGFESDSIQFLSGHGDGTFTSGGPTPAGMNVKSLAAGDLDGDGFLDAVVTNDDPAVSPTGALSVLLGKGDGSFEDAQETPVLDGRPWDVALADLDRDGNLDSVATDFFGNQIFIHRGLGDGAFDAPEVLQYGASEAVIADFDMDGHLDFAVANRGDDVFVFHGSGTTVFGTPDKYEFETDADGFVCSDLDGDGNLDLAGAGFRGVAVLNGQGNGQFDEVTLFHPSDRFYALATGDFNGDGLQDLVAPQRSGPTSVLLGGSPTLLAAADLPGLFLPSSAVSADFDQDGFADVAVASLVEGIAVQLGLGTGAFRVPPTVPFLSLGRDSVLADFDRDQVLDLAVLGALDLQLYRGLGGGSFDPGELIAPVDANAIAFAEKLVAVDLDGDGSLAQGVEATAGIQLFLQDGAGYSPTTTITGLRPEALAVGDLNQDGIPDLAVPAELPFSGELQLFFGVGDGTFDTVPPLSGFDRQYSVAIGDLNQDGVPDVAVTSGSGLWLYFGSGAGAFDAPRFCGVFGEGELLLHDVQPDGLLDIIVAGTPDVCVKLGQGAGSFGSCLLAPTGEASRFLAIGDVDRDRVLDLVVTKERSNSFTLLRGQGNGTFERIDDYLVGGSGPIFLGDIDDDLMPDTVVTTGRHAVLFSNRVLR